jgi:hypothetical protein
MPLVTSHSCFSAAAIFFHELSVRESGLRIFVEKLHVGMRRRRIQIKVIFLHVFAVIAFASSQAEQAFLKNRIAPVPQSQLKANLLVPVADAAESVFPPPVRP